VARLNFTCKTTLASLLASPATMTGHHRVHERGPDAAYERAELDVSSDSADGQAALRHSMASQRDALTPEPPRIQGRFNEVIQ
jgi:hypothetical protein